MRGGNWACPHLLFPGVLRGRPEPRLATIPAEPTVSKPVVPGNAFALSLAAPAPDARRRVGHKNDAAPGRFEDPPPQVRRPDVAGGAASHLVASLFAARFRVCLAS